MMRIWRTGKKRRKCTAEVQIQGKEYRTTVLVPAKVMETINAYLTAQSQDKYQGEDNTMIYTARFPDGKEMDIKCCGCRDEASWTEAVLFDERGNELTCTDVEEEFAGPWQLAYQGVTYIAVVKTDGSEVI